MPLSKTPSQNPIVSRLQSLVGGLLLAGSIGSTTACESDVDVQLMSIEDSLGVQDGQGQFPQAIIPGAEPEWQTPCGFPIELMIIDSSSSMEREREDLMNVFEDNLHDLIDNLNSQENIIPSPVVYTGSQELSQYEGAPSIPDFGEILQCNTSIVHYDISR